MMLFPLRCLLISYCALSVLSARTPKTRLYPKIYSVQTCTDKKHYANLTSYRIAMDENGADYITDAEWWLYRGVKYFTKLIVVLHRCLGGVSSNLCEYFSTWNWDAGLCSLLPAKGVLWSPMIQSIEPEFKCPVTAGFKVVRNGTLDFAIVDQIGARSGVDKYVWQVEAQAFDELRELSVCFNFTVDVRRVRLKT